MSVLFYRTYRFVIPMYKANGKDVQSQRCMLGKIGYVNFNLSLTFYCLMEYSNKMDTDK